MPGYAIYIQSEFWTSYKKSDCLLKSLPKRTKYRKQTAKPTKSSRTNLKSPGFPKHSSCYVCGLTKKKEKFIFITLVILWLSTGIFLF